MDVILYSTGCPKCSVLEKKLTQKNIEFTLTNDISKLIELGLKSAPILYVDGNYLDFKSACNWVNSLEV